MGFYERLYEEMQDDPMPGYKRIDLNDLEPGMEVILEQKFWKTIDGEYTCVSEFYRTIANTHMTVSGEAWHLTQSPNCDWPQFPPWALEWIYAGNNNYLQMWAKE